MKKKKQIEYLSKSDVKSMLNILERKIGMKFNKELQPMRENIAELELIVRKKKMNENGKRI